MYFSPASYTAVGAGELKLPDDHRIRGTVEAAVGTLFFGWSTVRLHRAAGRPGDPGHGRRLRWRIVPIAARLGMTKALSHGSICGRVEAMRSSGSCNTSTVSSRRAAGGWGAHPAAARRGFAEYG
jgi:hypothetical protein